MLKLLAQIATVCLLAGCNTLEVQPVSATGTPLKLVEIVRNPEADQIAPELESAIENGLARHGIGFHVVSTPPSSENEFYLTYLAVSGWDLKPFLKTADIHLKHGSTQIGSAHFQAGGGLSTSKFDSTPGKIAPLMDQLLAQYH